MKKTNLKEPTLSPIAKAILWFVITFLAVYINRGYSEFQAMGSQYYALDDAYSKALPWAIGAGLIAALLAFAKQQSAITEYRNSRKHTNP